MTEPNLFVLNTNYGSEYGYGHNLVGRTDADNDVLAHSYLPSKQSDCNSHERLRILNLYHKFYFVV